MENKTLYHGSKQAVVYPEVRATRYNKNFYYGFYCTEFREQAIYWTMGEVFERLIEDLTTGDVLATLHEVYDSWMCDALSNYNSDLFYQPRDYLRECYLAGEILAA